MAKYKRISATVSPEDYALAKSLGIGWSELIREAIRLKLEADDELPKLEEKLEKYRGMVEFLENDIAKKKVNREKRALNIGVPDQRMKQCVEKIEEISSRNAKIGDDVIMWNANKFDVPYDELLMNLSEEVHNKRVASTRE